MVARVIQENVQLSTSYILLKASIYINNMELSLQTTAVTLFWGTVLSNFIWANKYAVVTKTKQCAKSIGQFIVQKSKQLWRRRKGVEIKEEKEQQLPAVQQEKNIDIQPVQQSSSSKSSQKARKMIQKAQKQRKRRHRRRDYEQYLIIRARALREAIDSQNQFRVYIKNWEAKNRRVGLEIARKEISQNVQDFEKFIEDQLDVSEDDVGNVLPYDPFEPQPQEKELERQGEVDVDVEEEVSEQLLNEKL